MIRIITFGFLAGFVSVLVFHQGTAFLMYAFGNDVPAVVSFFGRTNAPFAMTPTRPLGAPLVGSQAFWGGAWGWGVALMLLAPLGLRR